jgi:hypothetical protein
VQQKLAAMQSAYQQIHTERGFAAAFAQIYAQQYQKAS